jgi:ABC-2 type transport system permease protein
MTDLVPATVLELRKSAGTPACRWLLIVSGVAGLLSAGLVAFFGSAQDHTFSAISFYTQTTISLPLPFVSVLLMTQDFGRRMPTTHASRSSDVIIAAKLLASVIIAIAGAAYGVLISVLGTSAAAPAAAEGRWDAIGVIILGSGLRPSHPRSTCWLVTSTLSTGLRCASLCSSGS